MIYAWQSPFLTTCTMLCLQGVQVPDFKQYSVAMLLAVSAQGQSEALVLKQGTVCSRLRLRITYATTRRQ